MPDRPPMCPGTWLLGNARALLDDTARTLTSGFVQCGPMFRIRAAWRQYTVIAGPEASDFMEQGLDRIHLSRERLFGSVAQEFGRADLVLKEIGPRHARLRPPLAIAYSRQEVRGWRPPHADPPLGLRRDAAFDVKSSFQFLGHRVDKGDFLVLSPVPSSCAASSFPEPYRFDPSRCRPPRNEHRPANACQPFGLGDRTCAAMGLVELMSMLLVATTLHERPLAMDPPDYRLRLTVRPLPSPDRRFQMRAGALAGSPEGRAPASAFVPADDDSIASFPGSDEPAVRDALATAAVRQFAAGTVIVREGEPADAFYLLERGSVEVTRRLGGETRTLASLGEGEWFGEAGLLLNAPRNATVTAGATGAVARVLHRDAFLAMVATSDLVASEIGQLLRQRAASDR